MTGVKLKSIQCVKDVGVTMSLILKFSQQCKNAAGKSNRMLGFISRNFSFKNDIILPLYNSVVRHHFAVQFWSPHLAENIAKSEVVQHRAMKMIPSLHNKSYKERLACLNPFSLQKHRLQGKTYGIKGFTNVDMNKMFPADNLS